MSGADVTNVVAAFEMLLEQIEIEIDLLGELGESAFAKRDYDAASQLAGSGKAITTFREKVAGLRREWEGITTVQAKTAEEDEAIEAERRNLGRLQRGVRTPEEAYYTPILKALVQMGGKVKVSEVLDHVEPILKGTLTSVDYEPLSSNKDMPRWRNAAQWARLTMVNNGLLKSDSARGTWEITDVGRQQVR